MVEWCSHHSTTPIPRYHAGAPMIFGTRLTHCVGDTCRLPIQGQASRLLVLVVHN